MSSFPYPPPPPPPTGAAQAPSSHFSNSRGRGNHRGGRGRGRGNARGGSGHTGGFNRQAAPAVAHPPQQYQPVYAPAPSFPQWQQPNPYNPAQSSLSANAYAAPTYGAQGYGYGYQAPFQTPGQYSYSTPPAHTVQAPMPQNTYNAGSFPPPFPQAVAPPPPNFSTFGAGPIRMGFNNGHARQNNFHGQKRKRDAPKPHQPKVKKEVAPAVPSFGANLSLPPKPPSPVQQAGKKKNKRNKNKKRKLNQLGLTPKVEERDEETDEDIDEEESFAKRNDGTGEDLVIPSNGVAVSLNTPDAIKQWVAERKRLYPTQANIAAKATLAALDALAPKSKDEEKAKEKGNSAKKLESLVTYESDSEDDGDLKEGTGSESGSAPDEESAKVEGTEVQHEARKENNERPFCQSWLKYGTCTWRNCKFKHRLPGVTDYKANTDYATKKRRQHRETLYNKFVETESLQKHAVALNVIKYLGETGFPEPH